MTQTGITGMRLKHKKRCDFCYDGCMMDGLCRMCYGTHRNILVLGSLKAVIWHYRHAFQSSKSGLCLALASCAE